MISSCFPDLHPVMTAFRERAQTAWQAREQELQEAAIRRREQQKEESDKRLAALTAAGYKLMTVRDFVLDGRELAASNAKVALDGVYVREGNFDVFYARDSMHYRRNQNPSKVLLLTENAARDLRRKMLDCQNSYRSEIGCPMSVMGQTTMCTVSFAGKVTREEPCVAVKEGS